jgi:hypothetical protein
VLAQLRASLTYANVMATVAVFVALGGTSYAVATGSIDSREIKNDSVRGKDIRDNEIRSKDVRNRSLLASDFKAGQLPVGPKGDTGPQGEAGPQGQPGVSGLVRVSMPSALQASESVKFAQAICPAGKRVIGAGADIRAGVQGDPPNQTSEIVINEIIPSEETVVPGTVAVRAYENVATTEEWGVTAFALCANVS